MRFKLKERKIKSDRKKKRVRVKRKSLFGRTNSDMNLYYFLHLLSSIFHSYNVFYNCIRQFTETKVWSGDHRELHIDDLCCGLATVPMITCRLCPLIRYRLVERCSAPAACLALRLSPPYSNFPLKQQWVTSLASVWSPTAVAESGQV